jgi:hypothetical protein
MRLPCLSGRPAIFQVFLGFGFSVEHFGHLAIAFSLHVSVIHGFMLKHKKVSIIFRYILIVFMVCLDIFMST